MGRIKQKTRGSTQEPGPLRRVKKRPATQELQKAKNVVELIEPATEVKGVAEAKAVGVVAATTRAEAILISVVEDKSMSNREKRARVEQALDTMDAHAKSLGESIKNRLFPLVRDEAMAFVLHTRS